MILVFGSEVKRAGNRIGMCGQPMGDRFQVQVDIVPVAALYSRDNGDGEAVVEVVGDGSSVRRMEQGTVQCLN